MEELDRIPFDPDVMGGQACVRDTRVPVSLVVRLVANDMSPADIPEAYPYLERVDIQQSLEYASLLAEEHVESTV